MSTTEPKDLLEVLSRLEYWRQPPVDGRRRQFRRYMIRGDATVEPIDEREADDATMQVMLRDVSRGGIGFLCETQLERGSMWRIRLRQQNLSVGAQTIIVRYCRLVQDGLFLVGTQVVFDPYLMFTLGVPVQEILCEPETRQNERETQPVFLAPEHVSK